MHTVRLLTTSRSISRVHAQRGMHVQGGVHARGACMPGGACVTWQGMLGYTQPRLWTEFLTDTCENITFPQIQLGVSAPEGIGGCLGVLKRCLSSCALTLYLIVMVRDWSVFLNHDNFSFHSICSATMEFFHNSHLIRRIQQKKRNLQKIPKNWNSKKFQISCLTAMHLNYYTKPYTVLVWGCNSMIFMHGWFWPIHLIHLIGWKSLHFEKKIE